MPTFAAGALLVTGSEAGEPNRVTAADAAGAVITAFQPYDGAFSGGVRVAFGDVSGDGVADIVTAPGPGTAAVVKAFDGETGGLLWSVEAFGGGFTGGVFVAAADANDDGVADVAVTPDIGGGPLVKVFDGADQSLLTPGFLGIEDENFRGGARCGWGDLNGDGRVDLLVSAGFGGGPRVAVFNGATLTGGRAPDRLVQDFFAFESGLRNGMYLTAADLNGDGADDLIAGAGPGGGPRVLAVDGRGIVARGFDGASVLVNTLAGDRDDRSGIRVGAAVTAGGAAAILTAPGNSGGTTARVLDAAGSPLVDVALSGRGGFVGGDPGPADPGRRAIARAFRDAGGRGGPLGRPVSPARRTADGAALVQRFERGVAGWTPEFGAATVTGEAFAFWLENGAETGAGAPVRTDVPTGVGAFTVFQKAALARQADGTRVPLTGVQFQTWQEGGGELLYGRPVAAPEKSFLRDSTVQRFETGTIFMSPDTGAVALPDLAVSDAPADPNDYTALEFSFVTKLTDKLKSAANVFLQGVSAIGGAAGYPILAARQAVLFPSSAPLPDDVREFLAAEFGQFFTNRDPNLLNNARVHWGARIPDNPFTSEDNGAFDAITFGTDIYLRYRQGELPFLAELELLSHELVHTVQASSGLLAYGAQYLAEYARAGFVYEDNQLEVDARRIARDVAERYKLVNRGLITARTADLPTFEDSLPPRTQVDTDIVELPFYEDSLPAAR